MIYLKTKSGRKTYHLVDGYESTPCGLQFDSGIDVLYKKKPSGKCCKKCKIAMNNYFIKSI